MLAFGEINKLSERNVYTYDLFFATPCKILTKNAFLVRFKEHKSINIFSRKKKRLLDCCKSFARFTFKFTSLARYVYFIGILQKLNWLQELCKIFLHKLFFLFRVKQNAKLC